MIRVIFEPRIPSEHIKDEVWYPEINRKTEEYYSYLYHESGRKNGLTVITYSSVILYCLELISKERNLKLVVELFGKDCSSCLDKCYEHEAKAFQEIESRIYCLECAE